MEAAATGVAEEEEAVRTGVEVEGAPMVEGVDGEVAAIAGGGAAVTGIVTALPRHHPQATVGRGALRFQY